jgi:DNA-binding MarR family transcriptional regulator
MGVLSLGGYAEKIYVLIHRCHEQCLKLRRGYKPDAEFAGLGLSIQQGLTLKFLLTEDGMTQKELTRRLQITSSSCGALLAKLEQGQYVERRPDERDKRGFCVFITDNGRELGQLYLRKSVVVLEEWASDLTEREKEQLYHLLVKLSDGLDKRSREASQNAE